MDSGLFGARALPQQPMQGYDSQNGAPDWWHPTAQPHNADQPCTASVHTPQQRLARQPVARNLQHDFRNADTVYPAVGTLSEPHSATLRVPLLQPSVPQPPLALPQVSGSASPTIPDAQAHSTHPVFTADGSMDSNLLATNGPQPQHLCADVDMLASLSSADLDLLTLMPCSSTGGGAGSSQQALPQLTLNSPRQLAADAQASPQQAAAAGGVMQYVYEHSSVDTLMTQHGRWPADVLEPEAGAKTCAEGRSTDGFLF